MIKAFEKIKAGMNEAIAYAQGRANDRERGLKVVASLRKLGPIQ